MPIDPTESVRAFIQSQRPVAVPRSAATVALVRDGEEGLDAFMRRRRPSLAFGPALHVFPGGRWTPVTTKSSSTGSAGSRGLGWRAVVRCRSCPSASLGSGEETFEEADLLLAGSSHDMLGDTSGKGWESDRAEPAVGALSLAEFLRQ